MPGLEVADIHLWGTFCIILIAVVSYVVERIPMETTSLLTILGFLLLFSLFKTPTSISSTYLLSSGFANPALISVVSLMVIGEALLNTGVFEVAMLAFTRTLKTRFIHSIALLFLVVMLTSAFISNTVIVVIGIPIITALCQSKRLNPSLALMPLSFAAIMGGMLTLIGSSPNLLISAGLESNNLDGLNFFDFTGMGLILTLCGWIYISYVVPNMISHLGKRPIIYNSNDRSKLFIARLEVQVGSSLIGEKAKAGLFYGLSEISIRSIQRNQKLLFPPFDDINLQLNDVLTISATRAQLTSVIIKRPELLSGATGRKFALDMNTNKAQDLILAEVVVAPNARLVGRTLAQTGFLTKTHCAILAIERRSRMLRSLSMTNTVLEAGDVLLVVGTQKNVASISQDHEVMLLISSFQKLHTTNKAIYASLIFIVAVLCVIFNILPIAVAAFAGVILMIATKCLTLSDAMRSINIKVMLLISSAIIMGESLHHAGGAEILTDLIVHYLVQIPSSVALSVFFLIIALCTNILSNATTSVLFTPIAIAIAQKLNLPVTPFIHAVVFAVSCSFATPIGYQTNLLIMGPGHYSFTDFLKVGTPLVIIIWLIFSLTAPWYYGIN